VPALPLGELGGCLGAWIKGGAEKDQKYDYVVQKVTNVHQEKIMNMMKVNEAHVHAADEKIEIQHFFRFLQEGLIFFLLISISHILSNLCRNLV